MEEINAVLSRKLDFEVLNFLALIFQNWICLMWTSSMLVLEMYSSHVQTYSVPSSGSVFYKCPAFHVHIPRPPSGVHYPNKSIIKKHVKPTPFFWHEKSAVVGRLHSLS
ncbi:uncharacterized protein LOC133784134 [Humulus lupulus]|nr:uncharacterized protein LOC133784134 [Humulus lupulus]